MMDALSNPFAFTVVVPEPRMSVMDAAEFLEVDPERFAVWARRGLLGLCTDDGTLSVSVSVSVSSVAQLFAATSELTAGRCSPTCASVTVWRSASQKLPWDGHP